MSATFAITTLIELAVAILLVYGFMHEEKVIAFEQAVKKVAIYYIRRAIRKRQYKKMVAERRHLRLHSANTKVRSTGSTVA